MTGARRAQIVVSAHPQACPRCGGEGLASAKIPHQVEAIRGPIAGYHLFVLCPTCDADDPGAGPLITFFHVHGQVAEYNQEQFLDLLARWASTLAVPRVDQEALDAEYQAWLRGEL